MKESPDPDKRITNADEQDVAVNHSTRDEGGYDEPASTSRVDEGQDRQGKGEKKEPDPKKSPGRVPGKDSPDRKIN